MEPAMKVPKRRFSEHAPLKASASPTIIAAGTSVHGDIRGTGPFVISGEVHGDGDLDGVVHLAVTAGWFGNLRAQQAIVAGRIIGDLIVEGKVEIGVTAVIRGRVSAGTLAIAKGAIVEGEIEVRSGVPIVRFEEQRHDR